MAIINMPGSRLRPISRKGRTYMSGALLLVALVLGFACSQILWQVKGDAIQSSDTLGRLLCGPDQHIDEVFSPPRSYRLICRDAQRREVSARNNWLAFMLALPFILLIAIPTQWFAWRARLRGRSV